MVEGKMTKDELREDKVVTAFVEMGQYIKKHAIPIAVIVGLVIAAVVVVQIVKQGRIRAEEQAAVILLDGEAQYQSGGAADALPRFVSAADRFSGTQSGKTALLRAADCHLELGNLDEARSAYERYLATGPKDGLTRSSAVRGVAATLDGMGQHEQAARRFLEACAIKGNPLRADDLLSAGRSFVDAGNMQEAEAALMKLITTYPSSPSVRDARSLLDEVRARSGS